MAAPPAAGHTLESLAGLLAGALGRDVALGRVREAAQRLGIPDRTLAVSEARSILEAIAVEGGLVGIAARFAMTHLVMRGARPRAPAAPGPQPPAEAPPAPPRAAEPAERPRRATRDRVPRSDLVALLSGVLGEQRAATLVAETARRKGITGLVLERAEAIELLEQLGDEPGATGAGARFAMARLLLR